MEALIVLGAAGLVTQRASAFPPPLTAPTLFRVVFSFITRDCRYQQHRLSSAPHSDLGVAKNG